MPFEANEKEWRPMQCPIDGTQLVMTERSGVEIDYCPQCRGVWLDRGELDKIIDRVAPSAPSAPAPQPGAHAGYDPRQQGHYGKPYKKKREGFLGELFDF
jgi:Zn-finger nucleic acid-binding protein